MRNIRWFAILGFVGLTACSGGGAPADDPRREIAEQGREIAEQGREITEQRRELTALREQVARMETAVDALRRPPAPPVAAPRPKAPARPNDVDMLNPIF